MQTQFLNPPTLSLTFGWTHVVSATGGKTVYVSGQVSVNERGEVVGKGDLRAQTEQTFKNLQHALTAVSASFRGVVKMNLYVVGLKPEHVPISAKSAAGTSLPRSRQPAPSSACWPWSLPTG
jgi:enamine deaminase RidA (YjgF/YER057c/UK114 family)